MFDIERLLFLDDTVFDDNHVFVTGLARSGTTSLLNAIYKSNKFASLTYEDMPFILAPNLWKKITPLKKHTIFQERAHGDNIEISSNSPEAFEEVFWKTYTHNSKLQQDLFIKFIALILKKNNKFRYLSKSNQNIARLPLISKIFPYSKILIPFREPLQQSFSLYSQHIRFLKKQNDDIFVLEYMNWIGHYEFGKDYKKNHRTDLYFSDENQLNHWLEQWYLTYKLLYKFALKKEMFYLIGYESLCNNIDVWSNVKDLLGVDKQLDFSLESLKIIFFFILH